MKLRGRDETFINGVLKQVGEAPLIKVLLFFDGKGHTVADIAGKYSIEEFEELPEYGERDFERKWVRFSTRSPAEYHRIISGKTQVEAAEKMGTAQSQISRLERGQKPTAETILRLSELYEVDISVFFEDIMLDLRRGYLEDLHKLDNSIEFDPETLEFTGRHREVLDKNNQMRQRAKGRKKKGRK